MQNARKPPAATARTGGMADLMAGDPNEIKGDLKREAPPHPQGAGGVDPAAEVKSGRSARPGGALPACCAEGD